MTQHIEPCPNPNCKQIPELRTWFDGLVGDNIHQCECGCGYRGPFDFKDGRLHNRIARAVREASELSHLAGHYLTRAEKAEAERDALLNPVARPSSEWHEDIGPVLWWKFPIEELPYCGTPLDSEWHAYHTHWTPLPVPWKAS